MVASRVSDKSLTRPFCLMMHEAESVSTYCLRPPKTFAMRVGKGSPCKPWQAESHPALRYFKSHAAFLDPGYSAFLRRSFAVAALFSSTMA